MPQMSESPPSSPAAIDAAIKVPLEPIMLKKPEPTGPIRIACMRVPAAAAIIERETKFIVDCAGNLIAEAIMRGQIMTPENIAIICCKEAAKMMGTGGVSFNL